MSSAVISEDGFYRYELHRRLPSMLRWVRPILWIMLNPSTADGAQDDPTIRRCKGFSEYWGCTLMRVGNLYAYRATDPSALKRPHGGIDIVGPTNHLHLRSMAADAALIMLAWGQPGPQKEHWRWVLDKLADHADKFHVLGYTKSGHPRHPLMFPKDSQPIPYSQSDAKVKGGD